MVGGYNTKVDENITTQDFLDTVNQIDALTTNTSSTGIVTINIVGILKTDFLANIANCADLPASDQSKITKALNKIEHLNLMYGNIETGAFTTYCDVFTNLRSLTVLNSFKIKAGSFLNSNFNFDTLYTIRMIFPWL